MGASPKGDRATSLRPQPASQSSRSGIPSAGGLFSTGDPTKCVQGEPCVEVKGGWWPVRFGYPPEHIRLPQQAWPSNGRCAQGGGYTAPAIAILVRRMETRSKAPLASSAGRRHRPNEVSNA